MQTYVGRVRTWYRHPAGGAQSFGCVGRGIELTKQIAALIQKEKLATKVIAASEEPQERVALARCDYILLNDRVVRTLNSG